MSEADLATLAARVRAGPTAVATLVGIKGSTPRGIGAYMIVTADRTDGTIGGGEAEHRAVEAARTLLAAGQEETTLDVILGPNLDQCCGGAMTIYIRRITTPPEGPFEMGGVTITDPPMRPVVVYGAGHVGTALVRALTPLPFAVEWIDARAESLWPTDLAIACRRVAIPEAVVAEAPDNAFHLVMTHSHAVDLEIVAAVLARPFAFLGLIGSKSKKATFIHRLTERGLATDRLTCPIGLDAITGKSPAIIAASVAAQLLILDGTP
ncbi:xanthine dehydrogenase accessory protein XdhC [Acuticoccus mangrovi]|uniref:Xanthine dehydrogenase accessory protein XdhC n=1 Tax=Acuticoccus mangrovi TaxID=2796142 RepID=A0A934MFY0_9HYPH|nr:xanthine dehydrogenase accessory protein XdhC [Acuticoccus mangrovi]MBJ3775405.1 xanthine dehydrogenase accessory protein XdhC [Acuticoccus mangrovi]